VAVYKVSQPDTVCAKDDEKCKIRYTFAWHKEHSVCRSNALCTVLDGDVCSSYGVRVIHVNKMGEVNQEDDICSVDRRVEGVLTKGDVAYVDLWYTKSDVFYKAQCYFWCTEDGGLPDQGDGDVDQNLVEKLVIKKQNAAYRVLFFIAFPISLTS
jgi:hypothetical protein